MLAYKQTYDLEFKLIPKLCDLYEDATNIFENLQSPIIPQVAQFSNAKSLEGIYSMMQENNSRPRNIESRLGNIES